jgi:hypothetical protein
VGFSFLSFCALLGHTVVGFSLSNSKDWAAWPDLFWKSGLKVKQFMNICPFVFHSKKCGDSVLLEKVWHDFL